MRDAEQAFGGEASSSRRRKRQRHTSTVDGNEVITTEERSGMLFELDLLDCPICCHPLTTPIFQVSFLTSRLLKFCGSNSDFSY
ncbi:unnamed protein product [Arabis nemorensis]|uniref:Uncharacterized protein n=1 Tax=Arabis nemorensis TaxID=586526 RepID=A0A565B151_9BRAS|nr:unnamed protein product [Arabis nemorensis]